MNCPAKITALLACLTLTQCSQPDSCLKPVDSGFCTLKPSTRSTPSVRFFFNAATGSCMPFIYYGCNGNDNNFVTLYECAHSCLCSMPADPGSCTQSTTKYFFNSDTGSCEAFQYGGCGGNVNNFDSESLCLRDCVCKRSTGSASCPDGSSAQATTSYTFDDERNDCVTFSYSGCGGNVNRFSTKSACADTCICNMQPYFASCAHYENRHYYYDDKSKTCQTGYYCLKNNNSFLTEAHCNNTCVSR